MSTAVLCEGLRRGYAATAVLDSLDLEVHRGERVAVLGRNGAGKTTLIAVLAGLLRPEAGRCAVLGGSPSDPRVRRRVGLLSHAPPLYPSLSAAENVRFWARVYATKPDQGLEVLQMLGLDPADRRPVDAYSQGMRRRAGLACAIGHEPELLLLDEPFAGLDASGADAVVGVLGSMGSAVVLATHEEQRAHALGARTVRLKDGRLHHPVRT